MDVIHKRTKLRRYSLTMFGESYTANHYALPMCQANLLLDPCKSIAETLREYSWSKDEYGMLQSSVVYTLSFVLE